MSERDADLLETQLFAALKREEALTEWARKARVVVRDAATYALLEEAWPLVVAYRELATACPVPDDGSDWFPESQFYEGRPKRRENESMNESHEPPA